MFEERAHQFRVFPNSTSCACTRCPSFPAFCSGRRASPVRLAWLHTSSSGFGSDAYSRAESAASPIGWSSLSPANPHRITCRDEHGAAAHRPVRWRCGVRPKHL